MGLHWHGWDYIGMDGIAAGIDGNASGMDGIWMASRWHGWGEVRWQFCPKQESAAAAVMPTGVQCTSKLDYCKAAGARFCTTVQSENDGQRQCLRLFWASSSPASSSFSLEISEIIISWMAS